MKRETIENILKFLEAKEGKEIPEIWFDSIKILELIKELENYPDDIEYRRVGSLYLNEINITKLPDNLEVVGNLSLTSCKQLKELPSKLSVYGGFTLIETNITRLPYKLYVARNLVLNGSKITELPDKLYVGNNLAIGNTPLAKKYTDRQIYEIVASTGGKIRGEIYR